MQADTLPIAYFGKIPTHGDFVRHHASGPSVRALDEWIQQGLYFAKTRLNNALNAAYDDASTCAFYFTPRDAAQVFLGVIRPSRDRVGRMFPFLLGVEKDAASVDIHRVAQVPVAYNTFFTRAAEVVSEVAQGRVAYQDLTARTEMLSTPTADASSAAFFGQHAQQTLLTAFWERLWGHAQDSRKYLLFKNLLDILMPLRSGVPASFPLVLRFPLSPDRRTLDFDVSFWIGVCLRLLKYPAIQPSFFWTLPEPSSTQNPFLLLSLRPPPAKAFAYLLAEDPDSDILCELEKMGSQTAALAALSIPSHVGRMLEDESLSLWDFMRRLH